MSVSYSVSLVYGLPVVRSKKTVAKKKFNSDTGEPYEVQEPVFEDIVGGRVLSEKEQESWYPSRDRPIGLHSIGYCDRGYLGPRSVLGIAQNASGQYGNITEVFSLTDQAKELFANFCQQNGIVGEPKLFLVTYVG